MGRQALLRQVSFPKLEADSQTHARDCECARCEAGFRPSESQRREAEERMQAQSHRQRAEVMLQRDQVRRAAKRMKVVLELEERAKQTDLWLSQQADAFSRLDEDRMLAELLRLRAEGVPANEAVERVEMRMPARRSPRR
ncbi:MAG: hypothetical protein SGI86_00545 [Deltaproteobacteria bacterium]|nr:hypothetical protein [Deltaproteobacteria bacterium]